MNYSKICLAVCLVVLSVRGVLADDVSELRDAAKQCQGQGLKSLIGYSCLGTKTEYGNDGTKEIVLRQRKVRGSFRSQTQWFVLVSLSQPPIEDRWDAVWARNKRLVFWGADLASPDPKMSSYGFDADKREAMLYSAETYFPSIISGGYLFDVSFYYVTGLDGFSARRVPAEDAADIGRCWEWSTEMRDDIPPYLGKIWIRDFGNEIQAIGKLRFQVRGSEKSVQIQNVFSSNPDHPSLIERVEIDYRGSRASFVIEKIEIENEPPDAYTPERFGLTTPVDWASRRWWLWVAAAGIGLIAIYLTLRYRQKG